MLRSLSIICLIQKSTTKSMSSMVVSVDSVDAGTVCDLVAGRSPVHGTDPENGCTGTSAGTADVVVQQIRRDSPSTNWKTEVCTVRQTVGSVSVQSGRAELPPKHGRSDDLSVRSLLRYALSWSLLRFLLPCRTPQYPEHFPYRHDVYALCSAVY